MNKFVGKLLPRSSGKPGSKDLFATKQDAGFTLLEVIVVVLIVGILAAIIAPGWLGFVNRQRVNKANDTIVAALQEAQRQAKRTKRNYSVSFGINSNIPQIAVYPGTTPSNWQNLGGDLGIKSKQILLGANLSAVNTTAGGAISYSLTTPVTITYDHMGILPNADFGGTSGLKIVVAVPNAGNPTQASGVKRCVIVNTLLGSMLTAKDSDCS
ncbi:prepilin-type N-terminal cleavage/methylation domain-containing protein [Nostoc sp. T09]|uniref:prepilin-type N-terminal cleavage/methylation domain-containing protein n=1 Tax=Nostoc sp. T09 TaxID=1932621 RepID=UPI000A3D481F|nr:prepilin-type N-terminal cleavage/methylation domain-containing protein [Nostoc sp. T09]OUL37622.1 prepilin-type N-terminal cleavage/methylation domain-containing protein [Nostoc sp. T09]